MPFLPQRKRKNTLRGVSILEALVAVLLLGITLPGLVHLAKGTSSTQASSLHLENASGVGQDLLDSLSLIPAPLLPTGGSITDLRVVGGRTYQVVWWYTPSGLNSGVVEMNVNWTQGGRAHSLHLAGAVR